MKQTISEEQKIKDSERNKKRWKERREEYLADKVCAKCGSAENLEIDHIDPKTKLREICWSWSEEKRKAELAKCQVLCHDCHVEKTWSQYQSKAKHGTYTMYQYGCRCDSCNDAHSAYLREYRKRKNAVAIL